MVLLLSRDFQKIGPLFRIALLLVLACDIASPGLCHASPSSWGQIMSVEGKTYVREKRSINSPILGSLLPGQKVKADFLRDGWYAVFDPRETERAEKRAMGYVWARRLSASPPGSPGQADSRAEADRPTDSPKPPQDNLTVVVRSIRHRTLTGGKEVLFVEFDRFYMPAIYSVEGKNPMIFMDITRTSSMRKEWSEIRTDGTLIRRVVARLNPASGILRITLEMAPEKDYTVNPVLYAADRVYSLEVAAAAPPPP